MKKIFWLLFLLLSAPVSAQDGIDLSQVVYHGSPNISGWQITVSLQGVEFKPGSPNDGNTVGVRPIFDRQQMNARWPDVKPIGWDGYIQYTFWACVRPASTWHCAGLHEFWSDRNGSPRIWTGAPPLTQWNDWVYRNQWGPEMETYRPQVGDEMVFGLTAGDRRLMDLGDVRERTNFIKVRIVPSGIAEGGSAPITAPPVSVPTSTPFPTQSQPVADVGWLRAYLESQFGDLRSRLDALETQVGVVRDRQELHANNLAVRMESLRVPQQQPVQLPIPQVSGPSGASRALQVIGTVGGSALAAWLAAR